MTTVAPFSGLRSASARSRATLSVGPPAAKGTTMVIGLSGKVLGGGGGGDGQRGQRQASLGQQLLHTGSGMRISAMIGKRDLAMPARRNYVAPADRNLEHGAGA